MYSRGYIMKFEKKNLQNVLCITTSETDIVLVAEKYYSSCKKVNVA